MIICLVLLKRFDAANDRHLAWIVVEASTRREHRSRWALVFAESFLKTDWHRMTPAMMNVRENLISNKISKINAPRITRLYFFSSKCLLQPVEIFVAASFCFFTTYVNHFVWINLALVTRRWNRSFLFFFLMCQQIMKAILFPNRRLATDWQMIISEVWFKITYSQYDISIEKVQHDRHTPNDTFEFDQTAVTPPCPCNTGSSLSVFAEKLHCLTFTNSRLKTCYIMLDLLVVRRCYISSPVGLYDSGWHYSTLLPEILSLYCCYATSDECLGGDCS